MAALVVGRMAGQGALLAAAVGRVAVALVALVVGRMAGQGALLAAAVGRVAVALVASSH